MGTNTLQFFLVRKSKSKAITKSFTVGLKFERLLVALIIIVTNSYNQNF